MAGRKGKLNEEIIDEICKYISNGLSNKDAICIAGVGETAFYDWINEGKKDIKAEKDTLKSKLVKSLKEAEAKFKAYHIQQIAKASKHDWKASAWTLERRYPDEFARVDRNKISSDDGAIQIKIVNDIPNE